jgi:UMP-CMP kinase
MRSISRNEQAPNHDLVLEHVQQGTLLPTSCLLSILKVFINDKKQRGQERFLIDGFPRLLDQGKKIEKEV